VWAVLAVVFLLAFGFRVIRSRLARWRAARRQTE
jgi:hypothetical protein